MAAGLVLSPACALTDDDSKSAPQRWDKRIIPIVRLVEDARGLDFEHPVTVEFLAERDFEEQVSQDPSELSDEDRADLEEFGASLRALGLAAGDADDLSAAVEEVSAGGTLAFYDTEAERIVIRGEELDLESGVTVAHELTHALQDQHFDLDRLEEEADDEGAGGILTALVEGDAIRIEEEYVSELDPDEQDEYYSSSSDDFDEFQDELSDDVPEILPVLFAAPYDVGPSFVYVLAADGEDAIDDAFEDPPTTDEHVFNPSTYVDREEAVEVALPELSEGEREVSDPEEFGTLGWYYLLASRIDAATALAAIDGWGGDQFRQFEREGEACVHLAYAGDTAAHTDEMAGALDGWAAAMPSGRASVERDAEELTVTSCAGDDASAPPNSLFDAQTALVQREILLVILADLEFDLEASQCAATGLAVDPTMAELLDASDPTQEQATDFIDRLLAAVEACENGQVAATGGTLTVTPVRTSTSTGYMASAHTA